MDKKHFFGFFVHYIQISTIVSIFEESVVSEQVVTKHASL